jgi:preprotein translocase subunit YajC
MDALLFPALVFGAIYFMLIRPQQKRAKTQRSLLAGLEVGDEIITVGGIIGRVVELHDRELVIESGITQLRLVRGSIGSKIEPESSAEIEGLDGPDSPIS